LLLAGAIVGEDRHEETLPGQQSLARPQQLVHHARLLLVAGVTKDRLHPDATGHVHHGTRLGDGALAKVELDLDVLYFSAFDGEVDLVSRAFRGYRRGCGPLSTGDVRG